MENTSHDNVKFSVYSTTLDEDTSMEVINDTPSIENIVGHIQEFYFTPESSIDGVHERDRATRFRLIVKSFKQLDAVLSLGCYIRITKKRHPDTYGWYDTPDDEQYIVSYINQSHAQGRFLSIGLRNKNYGQ